MSEQQALLTSEKSGVLEQVVIQGDLSKLSQTERVNYYRLTCESLGLNPFTRPFDYITLNGKLTLYAKKDATDQLRSIKGVSIDDVDIRETEDTYIVKVKGHDNTGRSDVEIGVVLKSDMQNHPANLQMKAVTKAKRRLTLSLCGLGWLDETEIETIPNAHPVTVTADGEIIEPEPAPVVEAFDWNRWLLETFQPSEGFNLDDYPKEHVSTLKASDGKAYMLCTTDKLSKMLNAANKAYDKEEDADAQKEIRRKIHIIEAVLMYRKDDLA